MWPDTVKSVLHKIKYLLKNIIIIFIQKKKYQTKLEIIFSIPTARIYYPTRKVRGNLSMNPRRKNITNN